MTMTQDNYGKKRHTYDDMNPRCGEMEAQCDGCAGWFPEHEGVFMEDKFYCLDCAPDDD